MGRVTTKLMVYIGIATVLFSGFLIYQIYTLTQIQIKDVVEQQAAMALEFDLAIRRYVASQIRPVMYDLVGQERFIPETMSTSFVARAIFEDVRKKFPDYIIKFSSDNPRNPVNKAGREELELIHKFNENKDMERWDGEIVIDKKTYMALFSARRMTAACLLCHGKPEAAPTDLINLYGSAKGFNRPLGDVIGLDTVAIPMTRISEMFRRQFLSKIIASGLGLGLFLLSIAAIIGSLITRRLTPIASHLRRASRESSYTSLGHIRSKGNDEINEIIEGYNALTDQLKQTYSSLEEQVMERTAELEARNLELKQEITTRTKAQDELERQEATMRSIFRAAPTGIGMVSNRLFTQVNERLCSMLGYEEDQLLGQSSLIIYPNEAEFHRVGKEKYDQIRELGTGTVKTLWKRKDGELINVLLSSTPLNPEDHSIGVTFTALDITDQEKAARDREYLEERLARSKKMEALGLLAGGVAHDLNNVLSGIVSYPDLLLLDLPETSPLRKPIRTIQDSGKKAEAIVQDLLTLARRGVTRTEVLNLNEIITEYIHSPEYENTIHHYPYVDINIDCQEDLLNIRGSSIHLKKTLMNLVSNALEAIPLHGQVSITTRSLYLDKPLQGYEEVKEGDYAVMCVSDNGTGIKPEDLEHIFEPFYTKKVMGRSGTGLGMSVVWGTVQDHSGYINVESALGKGTTISLFFPVTRENLDTEKKLIDLKQYTGNKEKILVVDDDEKQHEIAGALLTKLGYSVDFVFSGEDAVKYLQQQSVDLLLLDMIMDPGIDGLETYRRIIQQHPGQKAVIASGFSETDRIKEAQQLGAGEYVKKPYTLEKIGLAIKHELNPGSISKSH